MVDLSFLGRLGLNLEVGIPILASQDPKHKLAIASPGPGGTRWRARVKSTIAKLIKEEAIMTNDTDRIELFSTYINVQYAEERVPNIDIKSCVLESMEEFRAERKAKKDKTKKKRSRDRRRRRREEDEGEDQREPDGGDAGLVAAPVEGHQVRSARGRSPAGMRSAVEEAVPQREHSAGRTPPRILPPAGTAQQGS